MKSFYSYRKWFFDVRRNEGEYLVFFITVIKFGRSSNVYLQLHGSEQGRDAENDPMLFRTAATVLYTLHPVEISENYIKLKEGEIVFNEGITKVQLKFAGNEISISYAADFSFKEKAGPMISSGSSRSLSWQPAMSSARVTGEIIAGEQHYSYDSSPGYIDEVSTDIIPWKIPILRLSWGRVIHRDIGLTFSIIRQPGGSEWSLMAYADFPDGRIVFSDIEYTVQEWSYYEGLSLKYPEVYSIELRKGTTVLSLDVKDHRICIVNDFLDYRKEYGAFTTAILRKISRNPVGIKFLATADLYIKEESGIKERKNMGIIDEYVKFGS